MVYVMCRLVCVVYVQISAELSSEHDVEGGGAVDYSRTVSHSSDNTGFQDALKGFVVSRIYLYNLIANCLLGTRKHPAAYTSDTVVGSRDKTHTAAAPHRCPIGY